MKKWWCATNEKRSSFILAALQAKGALRDRRLIHWRLVLVLNGYFIGLFKIGLGVRAAYIQVVIAEFNLFSKGG